MGDEPVRTRIRAAGGWLAFQEFMIRERGEGPVDGVELRGVEAARAPQAVLDAIAGARAMVIGPSNPVISIRTILEVPGTADALRAADAPVVAVSPIVGGEVVKGPTEAFMAWAQPADVRGRHGALRGAARRHGRRRALRRPCPHCRPTRAWTTPPRAGASREDVLRFAEGLSR